MGSRLDAVKSFFLTAPADLYKMVRECIAPERIAFEYHALDMPGIDVPYEAKQDNAVLPNDVSVGVSRDDIETLMQIDLGNVVNLPCHTSNGPGTLVVSHEMRILPSTDSSYAAPVGDWYMVALFSESGTLQFATGTAAKEQFGATLKDMLMRDNDDRDDYENLEHSDREAFDDPEMDEEFNYLETCNKGIIN